MKNRINSGFWNITYEVLWITQVALLANHIFTEKFDFSAEFDLSKIIQIGFLILSIVSFGYFIHIFKKDFDLAKMSYTNDNSKSLNEHLFDKRNNKKNLWALVFSIVFIICYMFKWDNLL